MTWLDTATSWTRRRKVHFEEQCAWWCCSTVASHIALYLLIKGIIGTDATGIFYIKGERSPSGEFGGVAGIFNAGISSLEESLALSARDETSITTLERGDMLAASGHNTNFDAIPSTTNMLCRAKIDPLFKTCLDAGSVTCQDVVHIVYSVLPNIKQLSLGQTDRLRQFSSRALSHINASVAEFTFLVRLMAEFESVYKFGSFNSRVLQAYIDRSCQRIEIHVHRINLHLQHPRSVRSCAQFGELGFLLQNYNRAQLKFAQFVRLVCARGKIERGSHESCCLAAPQSFSSLAAGLRRFTSEAALDALTTSLMQDCLRDIAALLLEADARQRHSAGEGPPE